MEIKAFLTLLLLLFFFFFNVSINNCNENFLTIIGAILSIPFCLLLYSLINTKSPVIEEPTLMDQLANKLKDFGLISSSLLHSYVMMILAGITIWYLFTTSYKSLHLHKNERTAITLKYQFTMNKISSKCVSVHCTRAIRNPQRCVTRTLFTLVLHFI